MTKVKDCLVDAQMPTKFGTFQLYAFPEMMKQKRIWL